MSAVPTTADGGAPPRRRPAVVRTLVRADIGRLARHPFVLVGAALAVVMVVGTGDRVNGAFETLSGYGLMPVAIGTCAAGHLLASRADRSGTAELWTSLPTAATRRTQAALLALAGPLTVAVGYLTFGVVLVGAWNGVPVALADGVVALRPHPVELAQGVLAVAFFGALGVALGTWLPSRAVPVVVVAALLLTFTVVGWSADGWLRWALPITHHDQHNLGWVQVTPSWGYSITDGYDRVAMAWHLSYVVALTALAAAVALLRHRRARSAVAATAGLAVLAAALSIVQVP